MILYIFVCSHPGIIRCKHESLIIALAACILEIFQLVSSNKLLLLLPPLLVQYHFHLSLFIDIYSCMSAYVCL